MKEQAVIVDKAINPTFHTDAFNQQKLKLADSSLTPSAQVWRQIEDTGMEYGKFTLLQAMQHKKILSEPLGADITKKWEELAQQSLDEQRHIEESDTLSFAEYLAEYSSVSFT